MIDSIRKLTVRKVLEFEPVSAMWVLKMQGGRSRFLMSYSGEDFGFWMQGKKKQCQRKPVKG